MASLTPEQIAQYAYNAGVHDPAQLRTAVAISLAEDGTSDPTRLNNNPTTQDYSVGLWQINYFGSLLGPRTQAYGSPAALQNDPARQAAAMYSISSGGKNWTPWTTYTGGAYQSYMAQAAQGVKDFFGNGGGSVGPVQQVEGGSGVGAAIGAIGAGTAVGAGVGKGSLSVGSQPCKSLGEMADEALGAGIPILGGIFKGAQAPIILIQWGTQPCVIAKFKYTLLGLALITVGTWILFRKEIDTGAKKAVGFVKAEVG